MDTPRTTRMLMLLVLLSLAGCWIALARIGKLRDDAASARRNLALVQADIEQIAHHRQAGTTTTLDTPELTAQFRAAARAAGLRDAPEHDSPSTTRLRASDYTQTMVILHFEPLTLRQLITFLHHLSQADSSARVQQIELAVPQQVGAESRELWDAVVAVSYITYAPARALKSTD